MTLEFYFHPLASYCWKTLIALYENDTPFVPRIVDLMNEKERAEFMKLSPFAKFPVIRDVERQQVVIESSIVIEYLSLYYPGKVALIPKDPDLALRTRFLDRFYDLSVQEHMQKIVGDRLRPEAQRDPYGVQRAKDQLDAAYAVIDQEMSNKTWSLGQDFSMADCSALPALYYGNRVQPFGATHAVTAAYLERLLARPSVKRVLDEAAPYFSLFPE